MLLSGKHAIRLSEIRVRLNEISGLEGDAYNDEARAENDKLQVEFRDLEGKYRAALLSEGNVEKKEPESPDAETRERQALRAKVKLANHVAAALEMRAVDGAEAEYNQELGLRKAGAFPLELLAPEVEVRATTDTDSQTNQGTWLDRLFADTAAARIGVTFRSVAPGILSLPVTETGASAAQRGRSEVTADAVWTVSVKEIKPTRNAVRAVFSEEDALRLPTLEDGIRRDLASAITEGIDTAVFIGDAGASEARARIVGLNTATGVTEATISQTNKVLGPGTLAAFAGLVDGKHAVGLDQLRVVSAVGANSLWLSTIINSAADNMTLSQFLRASGLSWTARAEIEDDTVADAFGAFVGRSRGITGAAVAGVWSSGTLIRDPYSSAAKGEISLTLSTYWGFALPRASNFARVKFVA